MGLSGVVAFLFIIEPSAHLSDFGVAMPRRLSSSAVLFADRPASSAKIGRIRPLMTILHLSKVQSGSIFCRAE